MEGVDAGDDFVAVLALGAGATVGVKDGAWAADVVGAELEGKEAAAGAFSRVLGTIAGSG